MSTRHVLEASELNPVTAPAPPGSFHQYRVSAVDLVGRAGPPLDSGVVRLEKHRPPPLPVGTTPDWEPPEVGPRGVRARGLVAGSPELDTPELRGLLGAAPNALLLEWGWSDAQQAQDPFVERFVIYLARAPLDRIPATITAVHADGAGRFRLTLDLASPILEDEAKDQLLHAPGPYLIERHDAGVRITATVSARTRDPAPPVLGPLEVRFALDAYRTRHAAWERMGTVDVGAFASEARGPEGRWLRRYRHVLPGVFDLAPERASHTVWAGVASADGQPYVPDPVPEGGQPGNQSAVAWVSCTARFAGRPELDPALAPDPAARLTTSEPGAAPVAVELDLAPALPPGTLRAGDLVLPERALVGDVFGAYRVEAGRLIARPVAPDAGAAEVALPPIAEPHATAILRAIGSDDPEALEDRHAVFLAGLHPYRDRLFRAVQGGPRPLASFQDSLAPVPGRFVYRLRKANAGGALSADGVMARLVVRVPSMARPAAPRRRVSFGEERAAELRDGTLRIEVPPDRHITHLALFSARAQLVPPALAAGASLLRVPNRPQDELRARLLLRTPEGSMIAPEIVDLRTPEVERDPDGGWMWLLVAIPPHPATVPSTAWRLPTPGPAAGEDRHVRVWACAVTGDGVPSLLSGPWSSAGGA